MKLPSNSTHQQLGRAGETIAARFLVAHGYAIRHHNWRSGNLELDLVVIDPTTQELVFVEVKTRSADQFGHPTQAVNWRKRRAWYQAALAYLAESDLENAFRFDIISVLPGRVEHFKNVSWTR